MKIVSLDTVLLKIPFTDGGRGEGLAPTAWRNLDILLIRIETDTGLVGWGEAFGYFVAPASRIIIDKMIAPTLIGSTFTHPEAMSLGLQKSLALFGRYGITIFAISGVDIALWDIKAKAEGKSLADCIGGRQRSAIPAYASLVRYGDAETAARFSKRALDEGYGAIKLHEVTVRDIAACRNAVGDLPMAVDVNCAWSVAEARAILADLKSLDTLWLEEPVFPPEDVDALSEVAGVLPLAAGENLCTLNQFMPLIRSGAVDYVQPSVTKVGGISEFLKIADAARAANLRLMPHSPYFGPGYHATVQLCAADPMCEMFEYLYIWPEALPDPSTPLPVRGEIEVPTRSGLGFEPDPDMIEKYKVQA